jgi:hypothetical protein
MPFNMMNNPNPFVACSLQWLDFCRHSTQQSRRNMDEARRLNARVLQDVSSWMESYMRSPLFLELMRCNVAMAAQWKGRPGGDEPSGQGSDHKERQ